MVIFLDTSFIVAYLNIKDSKHAQASKLWEDILKGKWGYPITSDYIVDECFTLLLSRRKNISFIRDLYSFIHGDELRKIPKVTQFYKITQKDYEEIWIIANKYSDPELSFTDLTILNICNKYKISYLATFDNDFKGKITLIK